MNLQNMTVSHTVGDPLDYSALTNLAFHECALPFPPGNKMYHSPSLGTTWLAYIAIRFCAEIRCGNSVASGS